MNAERRPHQEVEGGAESAGRATTKVPETFQVMPPLTADEYAALLDGRQRLQACEEAGVEPRFRMYLRDDTAEYVLSVNLLRQSLTSGQLAMVEARVKVLLGQVDEDLSALVAAGCAAEALEAAAAGHQLLVDAIGEAAADPITGARVRVVQQALPAGGAR